MTKPVISKPGSHASRRVFHAEPRGRHPHSVPILDVEPDFDRLPDAPFEEGAGDEIGTNLRHRMISETAYRRYADRGYADGYDVDDWLQAEAEVDHLLIDAPIRESGQLTT